MVKDVLIIISGGVATLCHQPANVRVILRDYDNGAAAYDSEDRQPDYVEKDWKGDSYIDDVYENTGDSGLCEVGKP